jgi:hypothetical protein
MGENPGEVILTLKKRPKHSALGQLYMKPFRIPARKKSAYYINNLPSPRTELLVVPDLSRPIVKPAATAAASAAAASSTSSAAQRRLSERHQRGGVSDSDGDDDGGGGGASDDDSTEEDDEDDSADDEAFLPVAASEIQGQFERTGHHANNKAASPTSSLRWETTKLVSMCF